MNQTFETLFQKLMGFMNGLVSIVIGLAVIGFMWGIVKILFSSENEVAKKEGRSYMMYGIITLFVMTCVWGLVGLLSQTITPTAQPSSPTPSAPASTGQSEQSQGLFDD